MEDEVVEQRCAALTNRVAREIFQGAREVRDKVSKLPAAEQCSC